MQEYDVIVLGTGAAGLTAAITAAEGGASVGVFEKADKVGGTSAWSGGQVWIPNNPHMGDHGIADSRDKALTYIMSLSRDMIDPKLAESYVDAGPEMVRFLEERTPVQFYSVKDMPDYHPEFPGGSPKGGRTIECPIYPYDELGDWAARVTPSPYYPNPHITMSETPLGKSVPQPASDEEIARRKIRNERGCGQALIGRLLKGCLDRGIEPFTEHAAKELILEDGAITGVIFATPDGEKTVRARKGVILATGGFEWNDDLKRAFLRGPLTHQVSIQTNTGDGLKMAMKAGAMLGNMREAWWTPVASVPKEENSMERMMIMGQRTMPGGIMVNRKARRFTNEAANYNAFGAAFHVEDVAKFEYENIPSWLIFDQHYLETYGFGMLQAGPGEAPDWVMRAPSLQALADKLGIDGDALEKTVERWNANCAEGHDPDFGRGESAFDCWWGDPYKKGTKAATLGPLVRGPYYAVEVCSGALGTKGGPQTDVHGNVVDIDGNPIPGLYAAGNVMASPFGMTYGGPGGTLGPGMVFGYLSGKHAAARLTNR
ncbi:MAG: FAD-dependent oxidoreductase [Alphaproteobacteria bacterium]|nr:FAD-dependent oxidoreductase [Alphaproteobacteria bacterium]